MVNQLSVQFHIAPVRLHTAIDIVILVLTPAFLCLVVPDWIFTQTGSIDPYVHLGYIRNFGHYFAFFGDTYYGTRLPFIIPGYICYKIFPPLVANYMLHLGFYYVALFSLYFTLRLAVSRRAALLTAVLMGFYPYFLAATGWDYIDGAGIAYFLLTVLLLTLAAKSQNVTRIPNSKQSSSPALSKKHGLLLFLAGMSVAALIYTNTFLLIMIPAMILYYLVMRPQSLSLLWKSALIAASGVILVTIIFGFVTMVAGGHFLFFIPSLLGAGSLLIRPNPWLMPGYTWLLHVPFMIFPFFIFLTSLAFVIISLICARSGMLKTSNILQVARDNVFSLCHLLNFMLMLVIQLLGKPAFQWEYYASYLLPTTFLAIGEQSAASLSRLGKTNFIVIAIITISLSAGSYLIYYHTPLCSSMSSTDSIWYASVVLVACALCLWIASKRKQTVNTLFTGLAFLFLFSIPVTLFPTNYEQMAYCACEQRQQDFLMVIKSDDVIRIYDTTGNLRFWYSATEPLGGLYTSIASTRLWGYRLINDKFPEIAEADFPFHKDQGKTAEIPPGTDIVILSGDKDALAKANDSLNRLGLQAKLIKMEEITQWSISFTMTFIRTEAY